MALNIKDPRTDQLARELATATGETITEALRIALEERLTRVRRRPQAADLTDVIRRGRARPMLDQRPENEILGYDDSGMPA